MDINNNLYLYNAMVYKVSSYFMMMQNPANTFFFFFKRKWDGREEGPGHNLQNDDTAVEGTIQSGQNQAGPRWREIRLPVDPEPHCNTLAR